jgi:nitroimidazol reductase NimA-like FMN-containing flavoprotein (pyridoxamine 5'-phosphate oxidase superfamily)
VSDAVPPGAERLLRGEPLLAHLATSVEDRPHVAPVRFRYEAGIVGVMTTGRKLANVRENARVALSVAKGQGTDPEWIVTLRGTATIVEDEAEARGVDRRINERYDTDPEVWRDNTLVRIEVGSSHHRTY